MLKAHVTSRSAPTEPRGNTGLMWRLAGVGLLLLAMGPASELGSIWSLRAHPIPNVTVRLRGGREVTGELSRAWPGDWIIRTDDGAVLQFAERGGYEAMTFPLPKGSTSRSGMVMLFASWRALAPLMLLSAAALVLGMGPVLAHASRAAAKRRLGQ